MIYYTFEAACGCFIGNSREKNEDNFCFDNKHLPVFNMGLKAPITHTGDTKTAEMFAVFDGMGGEKAGEQASCTSSEVFIKEFKALDEVFMSGKEFFFKACETANKAVNDIALENHLRTVGSTVAVLYLFKDEAVACNIGDSKIFRIRYNSMMQISEDHTDEKIIAMMGIDKKPVLLQFLGTTDSGMVVNPYVSKCEIQKDDIFVLCSDGITDFLKTEEIYDIAKNNCVEDAVTKLIAQTKIADGTDNATVIVVKII